MKRVIFDLDWAFPLLPSDEEEDVEASWVQSEVWKLLKHLYEPLRTRLGCLLVSPAPIRHAKEAASVFSCPVDLQAQILPRNKSPAWTAPSFSHQTPQPPPRDKEKGLGEQRDTPLSHTT
jgi:hypothetical protein